MHNFKKNRLAILPDSGQDLLRSELALALSSLGFNVLRVRPADLAAKNNPHYLPRLLEQKPDLFFSVNLQGLIAGVPWSKMLLEAGIPVLVWFVDNPWHLLSAARDPSWKELTLAVTDSSFIKPLTLAGASKVLHMPLATSLVHMAPTARLEHLQAASPEYSQNVSPEYLQAASPEHLQGSAKNLQHLKNIVFVGRSAFPSLDNFFAGQDVNPELLSIAVAKFTKGFEAEAKGFEAKADGYSLRPDFAWWVHELELESQQERFWPGKLARKPGKGAVECNTAWRSACILAAQNFRQTVGQNTAQNLAQNSFQNLAQNMHPKMEQKVASNASNGITVFGDSGWQGINDLRPQVDYYSGLPAIYRAAEYSLNLNSLLLPAGLSQRIFDVWAAGGFCLTDWNDGLNIFPPELTAPVTFYAPEELPELAAKLSENLPQREKLRKAWQNHICAEHSYEKRLTQIFTSMGLLN